MSKKGDGPDQKLMHLDLDNNYFFSIDIDETKGFGFKNPKP